MGDAWSDICHFLLETDSFVKLDFYQRYLPSPQNRLYRIRAIKVRLVFGEHTVKTSDNLLSISWWATASRWMECTIAAFANLAENGPFAIDRRQVLGLLRATIPGRMADAGGLKNRVTVFNTYSR